MNKAWNRTHGQTGTPLFRVWTSMLERCRNQRNVNYRRYGGRGIAVDERWLSFENFVADMGPRPPGATVDRRDNDGPYAPWNCRWATRKEQARNMSSNHLLTFKGETLAVSEWAERLQMKPHTLLARIRKGWTIRDALTIPTCHSRRRPKQNELDQSRSEV